MTLEDLSSAGNTAPSEGTSSSHHTSETEINSAIVEKGTIHHGFIPTYLRNCAISILGARREIMENGRSKIIARTSRERLEAALKSIKQLELVEEVNK